MLKLLKTLSKICEGILWLYLPIVLFYWSLTLINLDAISPLKAVVGSIVQPLVAIIEEYFNFGGAGVNYAPLILGIMVIILAVVFIITLKILNFIEKKLNDVKIKIKEQQELKIKLQEKEAHIQELEKNKVLFIMLKVDKSQQHENYLVKSDKDSFTVGLVDSYETSIKNIAKNFSGKEYNDINAGSEIKNYIFTDTEKFLIYLIYLIDKIKEINKGTADLNTIFTYTITCSCGYDAATAQTDFQITGKMLNLAGNNEILITETLRKKFEYLDTDIQMKFESKGLYILDNKDVDVYRLKIL